MTPELGQFTQFTGVGVAGLSVFLMYKLTTNHMQHLTDAVNKLNETSPYRKSKPLKITVFYVHFKRCIFHLGLSN